MVSVKLANTMKVEACAVCRQLVGDMNHCKAISLFSSGVVCSRDARTSYQQYHPSLRLLEDQVSVH